MVFGIKMRIFKIICWTILSAVLTITLSECIVCSILEVNPNLPYIECNEKVYELTEYDSNISWTKQQCKKEVEKLFGNPKYVYIEVPFKRSFCTHVLCLVGINNSLSKGDYILNLTHELVHLVENTGNERYTEYRTFVRLWESGVPELHEMGKKLAQSKCYTNKKGGDYDCWHYINKYLKEKNQ